MPGHTCPGHCGHPGVPSHQYACRRCWFRLPMEIRTRIKLGYREGVLSAAHRAGMADARRWYADNPTWDK